MPRCHLQAAKKVLTANDMKSISTYVSSLRYMKKMVPLLVYNIIYQRVNFDKNLFSDNSLHSISFKTFKSKTRNHILTEIFYWCKGVIEALEKKYLRQLHLLFYDKTEDTCVEAYKFTFSYEDEPVAVALPKSEDVIKITKELFKSIEALGYYKKFNETIGITMEMLFYDEDVPPAYIPPNFIHTTSTPLYSRPTAVDEYHTVGYLKTGYHKLKCAVKGATFSVDSNANSMAVDDNELSDIEIVKDPVAAKQNIDQIGTEIIEIEDEDIDGADIAGAEMMSDPDDVLSCGLDKEDLIEFHCPCEVNIPINSVKNIKCTMCSMYQHLECAGFMENKVSSGPYICINCNTNKRISSKHKYPQERELDHSKMACCARLVLNHIFQYKEPPTSIVGQFDMKTRKLILQWMKKENIMNSRPGNKSATWNNDCVVNVMSHLFSDFHLPHSMELDENTKV